MPVGRTSVSGRCAGRGGIGSSRDFRARTAFFWRWNDDLDCIAKTRREQISGRGGRHRPHPPEIAKPARRTDPEARARPCYRRRGPGVRSEQMISPVVRSRPRCSFLHDLRLAFVSCLDLQPTRPRQRSSIQYCPWSDGSARFCRPEALQAISSRGPRRDSVEKSGTGMSTPISRAMLAHQPLGLAQR